MEETWGAGHNVTMCWEEWRQIMWEYVESCLGIKGCGPYVPYIGLGQKRLPV